MNTYTLRCGEEVPIGVECALPPMGRESATRQWVRNLRVSTLGFFRGLAPGNPAIQDFRLLTASFIETSRAAPRSDWRSTHCPL